MKLQYTLLALAFALVYGILKSVLPDLPLSEDVFNALMLYILSKLGAEIVGLPIAAFFKK